MSYIWVAVGIVVLGALLARPTYRAAAKMYAEAEAMNVESLARLDKALSASTDSLKSLDQAREINATAMRLLNEAKRINARGDEKPF